MKTNISFVPLFFALSFMITVASCGSSDKSDKKTDLTEDSITIPETVAEDQPTASTEALKEFDWNTVPESSAQIGAFPYLTAPTGFYIQEKDGSDESKTGYSYVKDFNKLIIFNGQSFYNAEGKVAKLKFRMKNENSEWNKYSFDSSIDKYLTSIGAKLLGKLKLNDDQTKFLNKDDDMTIYNHIVGDPYNEPVRFYALNHKNGKIMFQVFSNSASGEVGVVELAAFEQTIKAQTAAKE